MKYLDEFRNPEIAHKIIDEIKKTVTRSWVIMEICGGQTHSIIRNGIDRLLPPEIELVHGPGCPVCVTPLELIDQALAIAALPNVIFTSFGDMLRVPGTNSDLFQVRSQGGDVRMVYSPLEALNLARQNPDKEVVFFAVGFETTAPGNAMAIHQAAREGITNFSELVSHVLVPPAMRALLSSPNNRVQGYLAAGHVCAVMGWNEYIPIAEEFHVPIVPTGFEPMDILQGILAVVKQLEAGEAYVDNQYARAVKKDGNPAAQKIVNEVYQICDRKWRGIGLLPQSGMCINEKYQAYNAASKFNVGHIHTEEPDICISGLILQGLKKPDACPAFGKDCTPEHPLGATMVSSEGACSAYFKYHG
ncbi:MAG TPA: hydrogenase formation protein HypD [Caldithrix abyssi]|uniref:Hydrogenase formation protein HypD n=1 Tax=Caldithrix abyssi TaxID=187145 RepID=A0A7V4U3S9_CALAY|nr:hydrogenase formation protein HypD [Caldithrix abyssi]